MKRILCSLCVMALTLGFHSAAAKVDFSGTWVMDKIRSEGVPPDMEQTMTVAQREDTLNVETKVVTDQGDQTVSAIYTLNGKEMEYAPKRQGTEGKGKRTVKWTPDGNGFEVREEEQFASPGGEITLEFARKWQMLADGKTLVIELDVKGTNGPQHSKRTFVRK